MSLLTDRRSQILECALALLRHRGFGALTQTAVAEAAGIRQGLLTYYFPKRTDLLRAIVEYAASQVLGPRPEGGLSDGSTPKLDLATIRTRLIDESADEGMPRLMLSLILMADEDEELRHWVATFQMGLMSQLDGLLRAAGHPVPKERLERLHATLIGLRIRRLMHLPGDDDASLREMTDRAFSKAVFAPYGDEKTLPTSRTRR